VDSRLLHDAISVEVVDMRGRQRLGKLVCGGSDRDLFQRINLAFSWKN
jgi:hypothetical protein